MNDFNQDMQNLLNAYDSNWDDYLVLRKQFIEKYSLSVEKLEPIGYYNKAHGFLRDEFDKDCYCQGGCSMEAVYTENQVKKLTGENKVDKLQEHLLPYKKEMVQKIRDEKMQLVTADEFVKLHKDSLTAIRENDKLQEQLNTAKKALTDSEKMYQKQMDRFRNSEMNESARSHCESQLNLLFPAHKAYEALAAIGGDDDE